jgi:hypothetical protein
MIGRTVEQLSTQGFMKFFSKFGYELRSMIRHYGLRNTMQTKNVSNVQLGIDSNWVICLDWQKMSNFRKPINNNPDRVIPFCSPGYSHDEVHTISSPFHVGIGKDCNGPTVFMYMALTRLQVSHLAPIVCNFNLHLCPPEEHIRFHVCNLLFLMTLYYLSLLGGNYATLPK